MAQRIEEIIKDALKAPNVNIQKHDYFLDTRNDFYKVNDDLYDTMNSAYEEIRFPHQAITHEAHELKKQYPLEKPDLLEGRAYGNLLESLGYWTVYYHPAIEDHETALKCALTPFFYKDKYYLALGGCGMDLSPKLDAYQMLTAGNIPEDSHALKNPDYFSNVVGPQVAQEALQNCRRPTPRIFLSYDSDKAKTQVREPSLEEQLLQFTGTEEYHHSSFGQIQLTDGADYLREKAKCSWLVDLIESYQSKLGHEEFQIWGVKVNEDQSATVYCKADSDQPNIIEQKVEYTDFPLKEYEVYLANNVLLLKSEY